MKTSRLHTGISTLGALASTIFAPVAGRVRATLLGLGLAIGLACGAGAQTNWVLLSYAPSQPGNPLKGLMPTCGSVASLAGFPHSLQYATITLSNVMMSPSITVANVMGAGTNYFNWSTNKGIEYWITSATNDGCQLVVRFYLDTPSMPTGIPNYLITNGLSTLRYTADGGGVCPKYSDPNLVNAMVSFITAFGAKYDGDPRIAFVEAGLLGEWGEWHCDGDSASWWAPLSTQQAVLNAYANAFKKTRVLVRYPSGTNNLYQGHAMAEDDNRPFGYHDDSFVYDTVNLFMPAMTNVGPSALNKWINYPIGGEMWPNYSASVWTNPPSSNNLGQSFLGCVDLTHATYTLDTAVFAAGWSNTTGYANSLLGTWGLGYEFTVESLGTWVDAGSGASMVGVTITNTGAAPFYYNWPVQLAAANPQGQIIQTWSPGWALTNIYPGRGTAQLSTALTNPPAGAFTLLMRVVNPLPNGRVLRFANTTQDQTVRGWLTLGTFD